MAPSRSSQQLVDLAPEAQGDRIAIVREGEVSYLSVSRVERILAS